MSNPYPDPNTNQYPQPGYAPQGFVPQGAPVQGYAPQGQPVDPMAMQRAMMQYEDAKKSTAVTWILWLFLGYLGGHRYYLGDIGRGIAMTVTLGGFVVWALIDAFFINRRLRTKNDEIRARIFAENGIPQMA